MISSFKHRIALEGSSAVALIAGLMALEVGPMFLVATLGILIGLVLVISTVVSKERGRKYYGA